MLIEPVKSTTFKYNLELVKRVVVKEIMFAGITKAEAEKQFLTKEQNAYSYNVSIENIVQQSNLKGDVWKKELAPLRSKIDLLTNNYGQINRVTNHGEVKQKWKELKQVLLKRNASQKDTTNIIKGVDKIVEDEKGFMDAISSEGIYDILFPLIYGDYQKEDIFHKVIPNVFNEYELPLKISRKLITNADQKKEVQFEGVLDEENFDPVRVSNFFKRLLDKYDLMASNIQISFYSSYELDDNNHIQFGGQYLLVEIPGVFIQEQTYSLMLNN
jgi:hypothetical protein